MYRYECILLNGCKDIYRYMCNSFYTISTPTSILIQRLFQLFPKQTHVLTPLPSKPWFLHVCSTGLLKTLLEKEKLLLTSNFSFSHSVFYPFREHSTIFIKFEIVVCKLFKFQRSLKFVVWERVIMYEQFFYYQQCFLLFLKKFHHIHQI